VPGSKNSIPAIDITRRFSVANFINNSKASFDEYHIGDGERPDMIAYDYYQDETLDWLILLTNEILDPYFEWPRSYEQMQAYITQKYGSIAAANQTVHHYEKIIQQQQIINDRGEQRILPEKTLIVDYTTYTTLTSSERRIVSNYDYEIKANDDRRHIYLIDLHYTQLIKEQHPYIFEEGAPIR
jgi:hypothetical protein